MAFLRLVAVSSPLKVCGTAKLPVSLISKPITSHILQKCQLSTKADTDGDLVYKGAISSMVRNVKLLSLSSSAVGLGFQPYLYLQSEALGNIGLIVGGICSFFIFGTPLLLHYITMKYVTELYMKPEEEEFTAYTWTFLLRKKKMTFTPDDVVQPGVPGPFSTILVKGKPLFMDPKYFSNPYAYQTMMGYNKPVDWSFPDDIHKKTTEDEINERK